MKYRLLGAIVGDICGKPYEFERTRPDNLDFDLLDVKGDFTDDTVCTIAIADAFLRSPKCPDYRSSLVRWCKKYYTRGYGARFMEWFTEGGNTIIDSYGNGAAMRISPLGYIHEHIMDANVIKATCHTHDHRESYKAAQIVANTIGCFITDNETYVPTMWLKTYPDYDWTTSLEEKRKDYKFDCTCQGSVPQAYQCFTESDDYESAIKNAIWLGGDTDTIGAIAGSMAYAYYEEMSPELIDYALSILPQEMIDIINAFDDYIDCNDF